MELKRSHLHRRVQLVLAAALVVSVAANVLSSFDGWEDRLPWAVAIVRGAAPIVLLLVVEVIGWVPISSGRLGQVRIACVALVAGTAAIASFSHLHDVAIAAGEDELVAAMLPLAVDGLAVVCSISLYELRRARPNDQAFANDPDVEMPVVSVESPVPVVARSQEATGRVLPVLNN